ncbi:Beta-lactamase-like protein [Cordyceps fumosorosea ARSEF 2679]|uniref:Beta-lactamase-like protein n=1 Tax=Cordyceps fumosorosea (strain ARSEF 2679) TaxID=1081104 RepID=A0A167R4I7_CORFA|nr:Beta-lactamase-like protein [Cordyceps fumosorosea ARSEF 2679]OAA58263.1 Beta-lactamase-like protein [Cordyceps fumosorosea ARSEF 2679]
MTSIMSGIIPRTAPPVALPASNSTVIVRAIDTETKMLGNADAFVQPAIPGHEMLNFTTMCFLLEHRDESGAAEYVLFDCGLRSDVWNTTPDIQHMIKTFIPGMDVNRGVDEILTDNGFNLSNLRAMVWSHWHWDHIGDGAKYPSSTDIVVGPGFIENFVPGWPINPNGKVPASSLEGHHIHEPDFPLQVGGLRAHDYFGDGSFYILDVPGHAVGHICGLARTTPDTFILMGGDCSHFAGMIRPTEYVPIPDTIPAGQLDPYYPPSCPCSAFTILHPAASADDAADTRPAPPETRCKPFYDVSRSPHGAYEFGDLAQESVDKVKILDAQENVFVCLAHDGALMAVLPLYNDDVNATINGWKERGYKEKTRWGFLNELPRDGKPGRPPLTVGLWRNGNRVVWKEGEGLVESG